MRLRHLTLVIVPLLVASGIAVSPAVAGDVACPSSAALMTNADIPAWLSKAPKRTVRCELAPRATAPYLCLNAAGADVYGVKPREHSKATIVLGGSETVSTVRTAYNDIYGYANPAAGANAWTVLLQRAATCAASTTTTRKSPGVTITIHQTTRLSLLPVVLGKRGLALTQTQRIVVTGTANFTVRASTYRVYRSVGRFITQVEMNTSTRNATAPVSVNAAQQAWARMEAVRVVNRLTHVR